MKKEGRKKATLGVKKESQSSKINFEFFYGFQFYITPKDKKCVLEKMSLSLSLSLSLPPSLSLATSLSLSLSHALSFFSLSLSLPLSLPLSLYLPISLSCSLLSISISLSFSLSCNVAPKSVDQSRQIRCLESFYKYPAFFFFFSFPPVPFLRVVQKRNFKKSDFLKAVVVVVGFTTLFNILGHQRRFRHRA